MITAQDIREKTFEKATFGGYDMSEVDDFLEELAADSAATQKEVGVLNAKMKVLADKIREYQSTEEAMRMALVSAQTLAKNVEQEAQQKAAALLAEAQTQADAILAEARAKADEICGDVITKRETEENRLAAARKAAAEYIEKMLLVTAKQSDFLTALKGMDEVDEEPAEEIVEEAEAVIEEASEAAAEAIEAAEAVFAGIPEVDEDVDEPTRMFRF